MQYCIAGKWVNILLFGSSSLSRKLCEFQCQETNPPIALHVKYGAREFNIRINCSVLEIPLYSN